jgi:hypothetical protein
MVVSHSCLGIISPVGRERERRMRRWRERRRGGFVRMSGEKR